MSRIIINTGTSDNDKTGDTIRQAFNKVNANFTELYATASADVQIPAQTNNNGKYLTTNGTSLSWGTISTTTNQLVNGAHTVTVGSDGYLTVESLYVQGYLKGVDGSTGTTGQVLTRQSNGGVAWATASSGGDGVVYSSTTSVVSGATLTVTTQQLVIAYPNNQPGTTVNLPATPTEGQTVTIKKNASFVATNWNVTVQGNGNNIDGGSSLTITSGWGYVTVVYSSVSAGTGAKWYIVAASL